MNRSLINSWSMVLGGYLHAGISYLYSKSKAFLKSC
nr:MAG TPA_asm: hypothetical protein [Caudoviricetes sp.]